MNKHAQKAPLGTMWTKKSTNEIWQKMENEWHFVGIFDPKTVNTFKPLEECTDRCLPYIKNKVKEVIKQAAKIANKEIIMNNKEVIDKLQLYFLKQKPELVTKMLANCIVDLNRFLNFQDLSLPEADHLIKRTKNNMKEIVDCIKDNTDNDLKLVHEPFHK